MGLTHEDWGSPWCKWNDSNVAWNGLILHGASNGTKIPYDNHNNPNILFFSYFLNIYNMIFLIYYQLRVKILD